VAPPAQAIFRGFSGLLLGGSCKARPPTIGRELGIGIRHCLGCRLRPRTTSNGSRVGYLSRKSSSSRVGRAKKHEQTIAEGIDPPVTARRTVAKANTHQQY
jgi:hypothetical protein